MTRSLSLDTEFVWQSTYSAKLGLVQAMPAGGLSAPLSPADGAGLIRFDSREPRHERIRLIDPLACDGADLAPLVADSDVVKIFHAAGQDLDYISRWCGARFANIYDTSLAARFCGWKGQPSLQKLLLETLGVELKKDSTLTNWLKRPLSQRQLDYALDDVAYLPELADFLNDKAQSAGTLGWMLEATREFEFEAQAPEAPGQIWRRVKRLPISAFRKPRQLVLLRELAETRERLAIREDLPRNWVLDDSVIIAASLNPDTFTWQPVAKNIPRNLAPELETAFAAALEMPFENLPEIATKFDDIPKEKVARVVDAVAKSAERHGIDATVIGPRAMCADYCAAPENPDHKFNRGWRKELLADYLRSI